MLERRRLLSNNKKGIIKDNVLVVHYPNITEAGAYPLISNPFMNNYEPLPTSVYVNGVYVGEGFETVELSVGDNEVEVAFHGEIIGDQYPIISWNGLNTIIDLDFSRMDFSKAVWNVIFMQGCQYLRNLNMSNLTLSGQIVFIQCGVANDPANSNWTFENTTFKLNANNAGGLVANFVPKNINFKHTIFGTPHSKTGYPAFYFQGNLQATHLDLTYTSFQDGSRLNFQEVYLQEVRVNFDPSKIEIDAAYTGQQLYNNNGVWPVLYYNPKYESSIWSEKFPGWTITPMGSVPDTPSVPEELEWIPVSIEFVNTPGVISWDTETVTYQYQINYKNELNDTYSEIKTGVWTTSKNTSSESISKVIYLEYAGFSIQHSITQSAKPILSNSIERSDVVAGDIVITNSSGDIAFVRDSIPSGWTPEGVVVIPPTHDVYGDGYGAAISLRHMPLVPNGSSAPHSGSSSFYPTPLWPGQKRIDLQDHRMYAYGTVGNQVDSFTYSDNDNFLNTGFAFPSDLYAGTSGATVCIDDSNSYYMASSTSYACPSPYLSNGSKNPKYGKSDDNFLKFRGIYKTLQKTSGINVNHDTYNGEAAAVGCYNYTSGQLSDWYLPDIGELGYLAARLKTIRNTFDKLYSWGYTSLPDLKSGYGIVNASGSAVGSTGIISCNYSTWSSDYHARLFDWSSGLIRHIRYNSYKAPVHAFHHV